jgi:hypothetical protein
VADTDLNELQAAADVMVGAIGTSDAEALAIAARSSVWRSRISI